MEETQAIEFHQIIKEGSGETEFQRSRKRSFNMLYKVIKQKN